MDLKEFLRGDTLLADRTRLVIMSALAAAEEPMPFMRLLDSLELTRGNLASHLRKLEEAGLLRSEDCRFRLVDAESGARIRMHNGSCFWNEHLPLINKNRVLGNKAS